MKSFGENKIRITLSLEDLNERNIDIHSFMSNSIENQNIFLDMLEQADEEVGFNTDDCRLMIEALALKTGIFVLTITKFEQNRIEKPIRNRTIHIKRKRPILNFTKTIYSFESFDTFCDFCTFLKDTLKAKDITSFAKTSSLYEYNTNYYLILSDINVDSQMLKYISSSITEFAHFVEASELFERKIKEYGKMIIKDNAILTCMEYFVKK